MIRLFSIKVNNRTMTLIIFGMSEPAASAINDFAGFSSKQNRTSVLGLERSRVAKYG